MQKFKDRLVGGAIAGLSANLVKMGIEQLAQALGLSKETGRQKAAGFFLTKRKANTPKGKLVGLIGDFTIAGSLGVFASYLFTFTGKDYYALKGVGIGHFSWSVMYGIMSQMGATKKQTNDPNTYLTSLIAHTAFGITKSYLLTKIIDPGLYEPHFESIGTPKENKSPQDKCSSSSILMMSKKP